MRSQTSAETTNGTTIDFAKADEFEFGTDEWFVALGFRLMTEEEAEKSAHFFGCENPNDPVEVAEFRQRRAERKAAEAAQSKAGSPAV